MCFSYTWMDCSIIAPKLLMLLGTCDLWDSPLLSVSILLEYFECMGLFAILLTEVLLSSVMAGLAPEGTQFDARQYDAKMNEL